MSSGYASTSPLHLSQLLGLLPWIPAGPICDIGCGQGHLAAAMAAYGLPVTALDVDASVLQQARQRYGSRVQWVHTDVRAYRLQRESYAALMCLNVFPYIPNGERARMIGRLKAAVKPGGLLVLGSLTEADSAADTRWAKASNQISVMPTGLLRMGELLSRFQDWDILYAYEGPAHESATELGSVQQVGQIIARKPLPTLGTIDWKHLPRLGGGVGWRHPLKKWLKQPDTVDFIEVIADRFLDPAEDPTLAQLCREFTVIPHSLELSVGSPGLRQDGYIEALARVVARTGAPWWSDHLSYTRSDQQESLQLNPLPPTEEALETVKQNLRQLRHRIPVPLLLENIAYYQVLGHGDMDDATFLRHVAEEADCGILLDVANLWGNAANLGIDPHAFIERLPRDRVIQLHLAGGRAHQHLLIDSHDRPVWPEIWDLANYALHRCDIRAICIERDAAFDAPEDLLQEVQRARKLMGVRLT
ncbi:MAG: DUF692 family multinuclear iron-containing protein [Candidatus Sericytochromatia bacterium]